MKISKEERERMLETLRKYEFTAPEDGGALEFMGETTKVDDLDLPEGIVEEHNGEEGDVDVDVDVDEDNDEEEKEEEDEEIVQRRKDLEMRMAGLDVENAEFEEIWERLDSREREEFVRLALELDTQPNSTTQEPPSSPQRVNDTIYSYMR